MKRVVPLLLVPLLFTAWLALDASEPEGKKPALPPPPSPRDILTSLKLDEGLRVELVAAEPLIESPVAMAFDEDGKMWVVEMRDYPNGPKPGQPPEGRIKVLEDRDGDGTFEKSTIFAEQLLFANGLLPWKGGVFVTAAPHILYLKDTDGDGKADRKDVLFEGFATANPQLRVSYPLLGMDGWVYCVNGLRGGMIRRNDKSPPLNISGMDFRFDPTNPDRYEAISGMGQFGQTFDDWGNRFVCDNNHHLRHVVLENREIKRNPYLAVPSVLQDTSELDAGPLSSGGKIYPISKNWTTSSLHVGRFTAACGVFIYRGELLGEKYKGSAFTCDPTGNLVHQEILTTHGVTFKSKPAREGVEFLASPNDWFRPVFLTSGPDGAMYVVDMCRAVIEHPEFMPDELKKRADLLHGKDHGRIWRIVPSSFRRAAQPNNRPRLGNAKSEELIQQLEHANDWCRATAHRLLLETKVADEESLGRFLRNSKSPTGRCYAAWLLTPVVRDQFAGPAALALELMADPDPQVRIQAIRMLKTSSFQHFNFVSKPEELELREKLTMRVRKLARDPDPRVRFQIALLMVGNNLFGRDMESKTHIALHGIDDAWTRRIVASTHRDGDKFLDHLLRADEQFTLSSTPNRLQFIREVAVQVGSRQERREVGRTLETLRNSKLDARWQFAVLHGLAEGMGRKGTRLAEFLAALPAEQKKEVDYAESLFALAEGQLKNKANADVSARLENVRLLAHGPWTAAERTLPPLIADESNMEIRLAAIRALAAFAQPQVSRIFIELWPRSTPIVRREIVEAMLRQPDRTQSLLGEIEAGRIKPGDLDPARIRQLINHSQPDIRELARKLLQKELPEERKLVLERYKSALAMQGDPKRGKDVFQKYCATCHRVAGIGFDVGADIADTRTKTFEGLLTDILNPNQAIDSNYINYLIETKTGQVVTGVITTETASSVTIKRAVNQTDTILRQDIEAMQSTGQSLMPEGLEKDITVSQMSDLLSFLKNWRYLDGTHGAVAIEAHGLPSVGLGGSRIRVEERDDHILIETDALHARINKKGYVSGIATGSFVDKKTGAKDLGFGLHIMDFLLAPGWRDDGYTRDAKLHGNLPKHYVEGPQICTQAKELKPEIVKGENFVAIRLKYTFHQPGKGYKAGSTWTQTLVFQPGVRYCLCSEEIVSVNDVDNLFYRIDMPGHLKHRNGDNFEKVYLSYHGEIPASEFNKDFAPDEKFFYQRKEGRIPQRIIRAYQVKQDGKSGPWLAGMTLDPAAVREAWCHQRGYICMIEELHQRNVKAGDAFGAAYVVGWFDSVTEMDKVYDQHRGKTCIELSGGTYRLK